MRVAFSTLVGLLCLSLQSHASETLIDSAEELLCRAALDASRIVAGGSLQKYFLCLGKQIESSQIELPPSRRCV